MTSIGLHLAVADLAHGTAGSADEIAPLVAVPVVLLVLFVAFLRHRGRAADEERSEQPSDPQGDGRAGPPAP